MSAFVANNLFQYYLPFSCVKRFAYPNSRKKKTLQPSIYEPCNQAQWSRGQTWNEHPRQGKK